MKIIAVSQRVDINQHGYLIDNLDQNLVKFLLELNCLTVPVPNNLVQINKNNKFLNTNLKEWLGKLNPNGILLSGGNDIGNCNFRDFTENVLLSYSKLKIIPVFGICRGMQMLANWYGIKLKKVKNHNLSHFVKGKISRKVNSFHNYAIENCPAEFDVIARCSVDNVIEAIKHKYLPWEGCMWHPEREESFNEEDLNSFRRLFKL